MINKIKNIVRGLKVRPLFFGAALLSGALLALSAMYPSGLWWLSFVALIPLGLAGWGQTPWAGFKIGWVSGLALSAVNLYWLPPVIIQFGGLGFISAYFLFLLLTGFLAFYPALFGGLWAWFSQKDRPFLIALLGALWWAGLDWLKNYIFTGFNWTPIAGGLVGRVELLGALDLIGLYGLGFLVAWVNLALVSALKNGFSGPEGNQKKRLLAIIPNMAVTAAILIFIAAYGFSSYKQWEEKAGQAEKSHKIALIQASVEQPLKWDPIYFNNIMSRYEQITKSSLRAEPDLIVWPETSTSIVYLEDEYGTEWLHYMLEDVKTPTLLGVTVFADLPSRRDYYNGVIWFDALGKARQQYEKTHLVPFGEYVPLEHTLPIFDWPFVRKIIGAAGIYQPGRPTEPFDIPLKNGSIKPGIIICFESIFPSLSRRAANQGADMLMVLTNDAWFGTSRAPYQHWNHSVFRAIENRRPLVRSANTGLSGLINPSGRTAFVSELMATGAYVVRVPAVHGDTLYQQIGDIVPLAGVFITIFSIIVMLATRGGRKTKGTKAP